MEKKTIGILAGSLRKEAFSKKLAQAVVPLFPDNYEVKIIPLDKLALYNQDFDDEGQVPPEWAEFRSQIKDLSAVLFITPEYNRSVPAVLKNALDIASRPMGQNAWSGKPAAVLSSSPGSIGGFGANHHLRQSLTCLNAFTLQQPEAYLSGIDSFFAENGAVTNEKNLAFLQNFASSFAGWIEKLT